MSGIEEEGMIRDLGCSGLIMYGEGHETYNVTEFT